MVLGPPVGDRLEEAGGGARAALQMHVVPGRGGAWMVIDVRDLAAMHLALLEPGRGPRRYMAGVQRVPPKHWPTPLRGSAASRLLRIRLLT